MEQKKNILIFIIEDDFVFTTILCQFLETIIEDYSKMGIEVKYKTFYSSKEAGYELSNNPDIVLLDYYIMDDNLKPETASDFLKIVKKVSENIDVVIVSGQENLDIIEDLKEEGISEYIGKDPTSMKRLEPVLKQIIDKKIKS